MSDGVSAAVMAADSSSIVMAGISRQQQVLAWLPVNPEGHSLLPCKQRSTLAGQESSL